MLINIGLGHLGWEILPGPMGPGPCSSSMGPGPRDPGPCCMGPWTRAHGPRQDLPGKISQPRCPRPIFITTPALPGCADRSVSSSEYRRPEYDRKLSSESPK